MSDWPDSKVSSVSVGINIASTGQSARPNVSVGAISVVRLQSDALLLATDAEQPAHCPALGSVQQVVCIKFTR